MTAKDPLAAELQGMIREAAEDRQPHPSVDLLRLYLLREVGTQQQEAIRDHLAICRECVEELLDLQSFLASVSEGTAKADGGADPPPEETPEASTSDCETEEMERVWEALRQSLGEDATARGFVLGGVWPQLALSYHGLRRQMVFILTTLLTAGSLWLAMWTREGMSSRWPESLSSESEAHQSEPTTPRRPRRPKEPVGQTLNGLWRPSADGFVDQVFGRLVAGSGHWIVETDRLQRTEALGERECRVHWGRDRVTSPEMAPRRWRRPFRRSSRQFGLRLDGVPMPRGTYVVVFCAMPADEKTTRSGRL